jgi:hypothetical protein
MRRVAIAVLLACVLLCGAARKKRQLAIEVLETTARRNGDGNISMDCRVRNSCDRQIDKLIVLFDFLAPGGAVISTQRFPVDEIRLEPGAESSVHAKLADQVRAVRYRVGATDSVGREFVVANAGPFVID